MRRHSRRIVVGDHGLLLTVLTPEQVEINREGARRLGAALGIGLESPALMGRRRGDVPERPHYLDVAASRWCSGDWMPAFSPEWDRGPEAAAPEAPCPTSPPGYADLGPELDCCEDEWFEALPNAPYRTDGTR